MPKDLHEIRDPIHVFIQLDSDERTVLNSRPFQRLRYIHQLALTYLVYPGTTHRRFEHSLGVMELAGRVYDVVTAEANLHPAMREILPRKRLQVDYWRRVLRMAALCHDLGHLPFSHATEGLLPPGWEHEQLTTSLIRSDEMQRIWSAMSPRLHAEDIAKLAVGQKHFKDAPYTDWETVLAEIITGGAFGVDRMDYLLRDAYHAGVAYGMFDHPRLIDTLRILPERGLPEGRPTLGIEEGGIRSAEALLIARYFMFTQVYFHPVRRIYDIHLKDFLQAWLPDGRYSTDLDVHLATTDDEILVAMRQAMRDPEAPGHEPARRVMAREHFHLLYQLTPRDKATNTEATEALAAEAKRVFGESAIRSDFYAQKNVPQDFPVLLTDESIESSLELSDILNTVPPAAVRYVFVAPERRHEAQRWLQENRSSVIALREGVE